MHRDTWKQMHTCIMSMTLTDMKTPLAENNILVVKKKKWRERERGKNAHIENQMLKNCIFMCDDLKSTSQLKPVVQNFCFALQ